MAAVDSSVPIGYFSAKQLLKDDPKSRAERRIKEGYDKLTVLIKDSLISKEAFSLSAYKLFDEVFQLRIGALEIVASEIADAQQQYDEVLEDFEQRAENVELYELAESIAFTIRTLKKSLKRIQKNAEVSQIINLLGSDSTSLPPNLTYDNFMAILRHIAKQLPENVSKNLLELTGSSLMLETTLIAADVLLDNFEQLQVSAARINELSEVLIKNAQSYGAASIGLGIIKTTSATSIADQALAADEMEAEKQLAELGMDDYLKNLLASEQ